MVKIKKSEEKILDEKQEQKEEVRIQEKVADHNVALKDFLDRVEIEDAIIYKNLRLFPIKIAEEGASTYKLLTLTEALKDSILEVKETDQVSNLKFINKSKDAKILIIEGEIVKGGRQNRVVNVTMIIDEDSETIVPTSCVEQGRWSYSDAGTGFEKDAYITPTLYGNLSNSVNVSMRSEPHGSAMMYCSNQSSLWGAADTFLAASATHSNFNDVTQAYEANEEKINDYWNKLKAMFKDCAGIAAVIGKKLIFSIADSKEFFMPQFEKLLRSYILEALTVTGTMKFSIERIAEYLEHIVKSEHVNREIFDSPNKIGKVIKFNSENVTGSAFMFDDKIVHLSLVKELA